MNVRKLTVWIVVVLALASWFLFDLGQYFSLASLKEQRDAIQALIATHPFRVYGGFVLLYVVIATLSLPGAMIMTLAAGALFDFWVAVLLVSIASSIGATLAFVVARFLLGESVQHRFRARLAKFNAGVEKDGGFYLLTLRLIPLLPFFVVNLVMGLTRIRIWTFYWVTLVGMLPVTVVYVNAGAQLADLHGLSGLLSPDLLAAFALLALFPWLAKAVVTFLRERTSQRDP